MSQHIDNRRILVVDDNEAIHADIRSVLQAPEVDQEFASLANSLFEDESAGRAEASEKVPYQIESAYQGQDGFALVEKSVGEGSPYAMAFVDVRMPPGWDGIQTIKRMREVDPEIQVVICTAFSDYSWQSTIETLGMSDGLLILKKPFDVMEVQQLAYALTEKWNLARKASQRTVMLEQTVEDHADRLREANAKLKEQVASLGRANLRLSREVDARREADKQIRHMAFHDALTNLPNRLLLSDRIEDCIERCKTRPNYKFALLYCDIDNFKLVNDSLGHRIGDQLLLQVSSRLSHALRTRENPSRGSLDMVARLSGDEFVVLIDDVQDDSMVAQIGERIKDAVKQSISIERNELHPTISIGVAVSEGEYIDPNDMLRDADTALYHAKDHGKGRVSVFDQPMRAKVTERMAIESELRRAIVHKQFVVYYQPIHSLATGKPTSVEALVRWLHPDSGLRSPDSFIPIAEESGMIEAIGKLVLAEAVDQVAAWRREIPGAEDLSVSVNLSPRQLVNRNILSYIDEYLERNNLDPSALKLEITENAMMRDLPMVHGIVEELALRGVEIYLDDFGTGYSSLSILHTLPFSTIKIDRSFVSSLGDDLESPITIQAITMLAQTKGMKIVAEGIETIEQLSLLQELNCEFGQGYYFSRPLPPMDMEKYLAEQIGDANKAKEFSAVREASQDSWRI